MHGNLSLGIVLLDVGVGSGLMPHSHLHYSDSTHIDSVLCSVDHQNHTAGSRSSFFLEGLGNHGTARAQQRPTSQMRPSQA